MTDPDTIPDSYVPPDLEARVDGYLQREPLLYTKAEQDIIAARLDDAYDGMAEVADAAGTQPDPRIQREPVTENPKASAGRQKIEYGNTPPLPSLYQAAIHDLGARKYGTFNWRSRPIKMTDYISALRRHLALVEAGDWDDEESGLPHLAHIMATAAIVIDARDARMLIDDRNFTVSLPGEMKRIAELKKSWPSAA